MSFPTRKFSEQLNRLIAAFGEAGFKPERVKRIQHFFKHLPDAGMESVTDDLIDSMRFSPTPADVKEAVLTWKRNNRFHGAVIEVEPIRIPCDDCCDTGLMFCKLDSNSPQMLCFCHCEFGADTESIRQLPYMPRWEKKRFENDYGFIRQTFPISEFNPELVNEKLSFDELKQTNLVYRWNKKVKDSARYWENVNQEKQRANDGKV